jgi:hypothetical protein
MEKSPLSKIFTDQQYRNIAIHINKYLFDIVMNELLETVPMYGKSTWYDLHPNYILGGGFQLI